MSDAVHIRNENSQARNCMTERLRYVAAVCIWMLPVLLVSISTVSIGKNPSRDDEELDYQEYLQLSEEERKALPLAEKLRLARPAPTSAPSGVRNQSDEPEQLQSIQSGADQASDVEQGTIDPAPMHSSSQYVPEVNGSTLRGSFEEGATEPGSFLSGQRITPTPPEPEYNSYSFPRSSFSKMLMGFSGYYYHCSATLVDRYFLFTAGHCIYNHDPNDDGNMSDAQWADEVWVFPGQTVFEPLRVDHPFGEAEWLELYAYSGWTDNANINYDQAFMRIDRPMGDWTGWMGYETNNPVGSLNFSGYPVETPYVPAGTHVQYRGFDSGNVSGYTQERIQMDAFVYGGHSGGPVWRYNSDNDNRRLQGMNSTSDREGYAEAARITNQVFNDLQSEIDEPHGQTLRPDIAHCTSPGCLGTKVLHDTQAEPGDSISFGFNVSNLGFESSSEILVDFYLVYSFAAHDFNYPPSSADVYLGSTTLSPLAPFTHVAPDISFTVPDTTAEGLRNVAWIAYQADPDVSEYYSGTSTACAPYCNNSAVIEGQTLAVERLPELTLSPRLIEFGDVTSGGSSPTRYVQIENQGTGHLTIDEIEIDTNGNHFMVVEDDCSSTSLGPEGEPNNSCVFGIVFAPGASGVHDAMVAIISNDSGSPQSVVLRGTSDVQFFNGF